MRFRATLQLAGKTATGIEVPPEVVEALGAGRRPPVTVTLGAHTYRSTVAVMGGVYMVGVSAANRAAAGVAAGDQLDVDLELDTAPREVAVPPDVKAALDSAPSALRAFDALSYSARSGIVQQIEAAKTDQTRQRRIDKAVAALLGRLS
jgi:hypothetical protein